jgi:signal transduction histidine kinase
MNRDAPLRILVVDDDELDRRAVCRYLQQCGVPAIPEQATTAEEALQRLASSRYDCILLDYYIPGVNAQWLLGAIRQAAAAVPVVIFTGRGDEEIAVEFMKAGVADYLPKASLGPERLASSLRHAMELQRAADARRRAEEEVRALANTEREARIEAENAIKARDEVLAIVAHDLRNPMQTIMSAAAMIRLRGNDEALRKDNVALIETSMREMERQISDLLDVARIEAGSLAIRTAPIDARDLIHQAVERFQPQAREREISMTGDIGTELPPLNGDRDRLLQVLSNLIGNALKFTPAGGRIMVCARPVESAVQISVQDSGTGISAAHLPHVFDRYWQVDRMSRSGAGLGLAICKGIVEAHGGSVWVDSTVGRGTTVHFTVPCIQQ